MDKQELELQAVIGFNGNVRKGLILHPDNEHLIFPLGSTVVLRNLIQRTQSFLQGHDNQVSCITCSRSGNYLASGQKTFMGFQADVIIWDFHTRKELHRLSLHKVAVQSLAFSFNEVYLASLGGQDDNSLVIWDVKSGGAICGTPAAPDTAHCVTFFNTSDKHLVTGGNYHVRLWQFDLENKKLRPTNVNLGFMKRVTCDVFCDKDDEVREGARGMGYSCEARAMYPLIPHLRESVMASQNAYRGGGVLTGVLDLRFNSRDGKSDAMSIRPIACRI
eukprot:GEMP01075616.1.p1 GENE.GEMP01075616.1~~GEMP01075616.1.p1  ORF type:complete len:276 (+),score=20.27 GEMP01075616.1:168-995(+)